MDDHTVSVDRSTTPAALVFAARFNAAVPFIDRHLEEGRGGKVVIRAGEETVTYGALAANVNRAGNALLDLGLEPGARLVMVVKDSPAFFYLFWGAIKAGIVPVPVSTLLRASDYTFMLEDSGCGLCAYSPEFAAEVVPALDAADPGPAQHLATEGAGVTLATLMAAASEILAPASVTAEDDCFWLYSSGTTGRPKGAVHRQRDMVVTSEHYGVATLGLRADDVCFSAAKLFFAYGLGNAMTFPLWVGASTVLLPGRRARTRLSKSSRPTNRACSTGCRRSTRRSSGRWRRPPAISLRCGSACRPARRCRRASTGAGRRAWGSTFSMASAPPRRCISSSPTAPAT